MPTIVVPDGSGPVTERVYKLQPAYAAPAAAMRDAVTTASILSARVREAVRYRIAEINGCLLCQASRSRAAAESGFTEQTYTDISGYRTSLAFSAAEKLAIEFAEKFCLDHQALDRQFFDRLRGHFSDAEIFDLTFFAGRYLAFGRLTHVLGLDDACVFDTQIGEGLSYLDL